MSVVEWLRKYLPQDDQADDWYAWLVNQTSHVALGILYSLIVSVAFFAVAGEFPEKEYAWPAILAFVLATEFVRGWSGWDSSEDVIFTAIYGAGGAFAVFSEVAPGSPVLLVSASDVFPVLCMAGFHLFCGVYLRWPT